MQVLSTILYILLFIVFLSVLIIVHELGHLAAAKAFNVYCLEYSVGMGPLLFQFKRKNGETQFSLRGIPFRGYASMYG
jgi:regulator of sigma E protease